MSPFLILSDDCVQIISGKMESAYDWFTVNYLEGVINFTNINQKNNQSITTLDVGGESMEISFESDISDLYTGQVVELNIPNFHTYLVYSFSYLNYGIVGALANMIKVSQK